MYRVINEDCYYHDDSRGGWRLVSRSDLPADIADKLDKSSVEYRYDLDDCEIWDAVVRDDDGNKYRISYCVSSLAIQREANERYDDLSGIRWDRPSYYVEI